ncbi:hypothetical protein BCF11_5458 [Collimonas sp. PA-H2]|uniref:CPBP family intramembrane glutamic endopeptidase n=1 Tax=Collimonas sp. PA-H2 TaxID=1881062 RepID=UPI000C01DD55|nr:type II CAAX endopeptidase family protein [Collimonas sp. PA-H2]PFH04669.1 hypothetical protein BCF11_5458 [Collimonas sp. PA-H2]
MQNNIPMTSSSERKISWQSASQWPLLRILLGIGAIVIPIALAQFALSQLKGAVPLAHDIARAISLGNLLTIVLALLAYRFYVHSVERRRCDEFSSSSAFLELSGGVLLGAAMFSLVLAILWLTGHYRITANGAWSTLFPAAMAAGAAAVSEELIFRGLIFRISERALGTWLALLISAALFGAVHYLNPGAGLQGALSIMLEAGIFLAAAFMLKRRLWLPVGAHFAWNFTQGGIFGLAVSGGKGSGLLQGEVSGPLWLSGGVFGLEASVVAIAICFLVATLLLLRAAAKGNWVKAPWRHRSLAPAAS